MSQSKPNLIMHTRLMLMVFFLLVFSKQEMFSQAGLSHELGVIVGPVALYSDFGQRNDFKTNVGNTGIGVGVVHYLNFAYNAECNCYSRDTYFNDHFKIRNEISYHKSNLEHYGEWVADDQTSQFADQLRAMTGSTSVLEIGSQLEYFPLSIRDFMSNGHRLTPFISLGVHWVNFSPEVKSTLGPLNQPGSTPDKYFNGFQNERGSTWAVVGGVGVRYKLNTMSDLMLDARWQQYFSDWVDGLNPSYENNGTVQVPENQANDWMFWLNVGYIYYLD